MGGQGSGRPPKPENVIKRMFEPKTAIATNHYGDFFLPNNSGDHVKSIKSNAPVNDNDLVNKKYVDDNAYTDADAVSAVATADDYLKNDGDTASGDYNFSSGTLFIDDSESRVGIRTDTPSANLQIKGESTDTGRILMIDGESSFVQPVRISHTHTYVGGGSTAITIQPFIKPSSDSLNAAGTRNTCTIQGSTAMSLVSVNYYGAIMWTDFTGSLNELNNVYVTSPEFRSGATGTISTNYGFRIKNQGHANITNSYGLYIDAQSGSSSNSYAFTVGGSMYINNDGSIQPASIADASAANNSIYYSTTQSKLVYKDSGGTVNNLY